MLSSDFSAPSRQLGIPVEAELGHVGNETVYEEALAGYHYTDPYQAAEFVERTGCDSLAVANNEKLMDDLGANVTPAIYYMSKENTLQQAVGLPDQKTLNIIMGNK